MNFIFFGGLLLAASCVVDVSNAQIPLVGSCPSFDCCKEPIDPTAIENSNGLWYLYGGVPFFFDQNSRCNNANVTLLPDNYIYINISQFDNTLEEIRNYNIFGNYSLDGNLDAVVSNLKFPINYEIIQLTPDYIILVSCSECGFFSKEGAGLYFYVYTRKQLPVYPVTEEIFAKLEKCKIPTDADTFIQHSQSNCGNFILGSGC